MFFEQIQINVVETMKGSCLLTSILMNYELCAPVEGRGDFCKTEMLLEKPPLHVIKHTCHETRWQAAMGLSQGHRVQGMGLSFCLGNGCIEVHLINVSICLECIFLRNVCVCEAHK